MDTNLPMKVDNNSALIENKRNHSRMLNNLKRIGRIGKNLLIAGGGIIVAVGGTYVALPVVGTAITALGFGAYVASSTKAVCNMIFKKDDDMMFVTRKKLNGDNAIYQDSLDFKGFSVMKGYEPSEKAALMGLQNLVGLQRYKQEFMDRGREKKLSRDEKTNVYNEVFSTVTHGINIKTFQALENLGYIQIESMESRGQKLLISEKLEFGQSEEAKQSIKAFLTNNKEEKKKHLKEMNEIRFKLTDKQLNIDDIYKQYMEAGPRGNRDLKRIGIIIRALREKNIDIQIDNIGIPRINYKAQLSLAKRVEQDVKIDEDAKKFKEELKEVDEKQVIQAKEQSKRIEIENER